MIQDIAPSELHNHFTGEHIQPHDRLLCFDQDGSLSFSYESGELFCYHAIIVSIEPDDSFSSADLAG